MRISYLLLDPGIPVFGTKGASVHVQEVVRTLRTAGHEVTVHALRIGKDVPADLVDLPVQHHRLPSGLDAAARERALAAISDEVAAAAAAEQGHTVPFVLEVNAPLVEEQAAHRSLSDTAGAWAATARQFAAARVLACVSEPVAAWAREHGAAAEAVHVLPNGVNVDGIRPADPARPTTDERDLVVGFVGTLKPWHGTDVLLRAAARTRHTLRLEIIGTGPCCEELEQLADELGLGDRVRFRGALAPADVPRALQGLDLAVAPYPRGPHYFSPLKVYEYLAAGLPIIASAIGSLPELLQDGELGVLVPAGDVEALATALDDLARDPARRTELGQSAREAAVTDHSWTSRCRDLLALVVPRERIEDRS